MATERRSQLANRKLALERMVERLERLFRKPKPRKKTRKSRGVRGRELDSKRKESAKKAERRKLE